MALRRSLATMAAAALLGLLIFGVSRVPAPVTSADWAAWTQAVGSIIAILAAGAFAVAVPVYMRLVETREVARRTAYLAEDAIARLEAIWNSSAKWMTKGEFSEVSESLIVPDLDLAQAQLDALPRHIMDGKLALAVGSVRGQVLNLRKVVRYAIDRPSSQQELGRALKSTLRVGRESRAALRNTRLQRIGLHWYVMPADGPGIPFYEAWAAEMPKEPKSPDKGRTR